MSYLPTRRHEIFEVNEIDFAGNAVRVYLIDGSSRYAGLGGEPEAIDAILYQVGHTYAGVREIEWGDDTTDWVCLVTLDRH